MTTSLLSQLESKIDKLSNTDKSWVTFIHDHINFIRNEATTIPVTDADRDRYRHKFEHFLRDNQCHQSVIWIAFLINDLSMYEEFIFKDTVMIPNISYINTLYRKYRTSKNLV